MNFKLTAFHSPLPTISTKYKIVTLNYNTNIVCDTPLPSVRIDIDTVFADRQIPLNSPVDLLIKQVILIKLEKTMLFWADLQVIQLLLEITLL